MTLKDSWRANINGRLYRANDLQRGQQLNVYLPEDRFALAIADDDAEVVEMMPIEEAVAMPTTASPLFLVGLAGGGLLALGGLLVSLRRRRA